MIPEIQSYLQQPNPDFTSGFALFCKYSPNRILISSIGRRQDLEMLTYELGKLNNAGFVAINSDAAIQQVQATHSVPAAVPAARPARPEEPERYRNPHTNQALEKQLQFRTYDDRRTRRSDLPPELQAEFDANAEAYKLRRGAHEKMKLAKTDKDRAYFRSVILETQDAINARWKKIDEYQEQAAEASQKEAFNEKSARSYISKALKAGSVTDARAAGVRARVKALLDHGCNITDDTIKSLKDRNLLF